jgi:hypothetical protein
MVNYSIGEDVADIMRNLLKCTNLAAFPTAHRNKIKSSGAFLHQRTINSTNHVE